MLMTTGAIQDHDRIKEDLGFTEEPALLDPALNKGVKLRNTSLLSYSVISSLTSRKGIPAKPISFKSYTKLTNTFN